MGVESKIRELMEGAANRPKDKQQGDTTAPTQGNSNSNPEKQDLSGTGNAEGGLTSPVGKAASNKSSKDTTLPKGQGAGKAANFTDKEDPKSVVNQSTSAGVREEVEEEDLVEIEEETDDFIEEEKVEGKKYKICNTCDGYGNNSTDGKRCKACNGKGKKEFAVEEALYEEDLAALFESDENLSEEFKTKAAEIFEAVITSRVASEVDSIEAELTEQANLELESKLEEMVENVDKYLNYVTETWMTENEMAIENGLRNEITESFIKGLQKVFVEHYIEVPEEKYDVLSEMQTKIVDLECMVEEQIQVNVDLTEEAVQLKKEKIFAVISEDLATTEAEKFATLVEDISYTSSESYENKLKVVKENYFKKSIPEESDKLDDSLDGATFADVSTIMTRYSHAISKSSKF